jgi:hypothetical protein
MDTSDRTHSLGLAAELRMAQKTSDKPRCVIRPRVQPNQTVGRMHQRAVEESLVQGEKRGATMTVQEWDNVRVLHPESGELSTDLTEGDVPLLQ